MREKFGYVQDQVLRYNTGSAIWPKNSRQDGFKKLTTPISYAAPRCCKFPYWGLTTKNLTPPISDAAWRCCKRCKGLINASEFLQHRGAAAGNGGVKLRPLAAASSVPASDCFLDRWLPPGMAFTSFLVVKDIYPLTSHQ